jgi:hypothetical protein
MTEEDKSIGAIIDLRIREMLEEMADLPPGQRESMAGAIQKLLVAKPLASDGNMDLFNLLSQMDKGPRPASGGEEV